MSLSRAQNAITTAFYADAATMPLHWIYNQATIVEKLADGSSAVFYHTPSCPFYKHPAGTLSPWGNEALPLLESLASRGGFELEHAAVTYHTFFPLHAAAGDKGYEGYLNHVSKDFVANRDAGKPWNECAVKDSQASGITKVQILAARYAGNTETLLAKVDESVRLLQDSEISPVASRLLARVLERSILTGEAAATAMAAIAPTIPPGLEKNMLEFALSDARIAEFLQIADAVPDVVDDSYPAYMPLRMQVIRSLFEKTIAEGSLAAALADTTYPEKEAAQVAAAAAAVAGVAPSLPLAAPHSEVLAAFGLSCMLPQSLVAPLYLARKCATLEEAVDANIRAGGDSCSRAICIGALYGAAGAACPTAWAGKVRPELADQFQGLAVKVCSSNSALA